MNINATQARQLTLQGTTSEERIKKMIWRVEEAVKQTAKTQKSEVEITMYGLQNEEEWNTLIKHVQDQGFAITLIPATYESSNRTYKVSWYE